MLKGIATVACAFAVAASVVVGLPRGADAARIPSFTEWTDNGDFDLTGSSSDERTLLSSDYDFAESVDPLSETRFSFGLDYSGLSAGFETLDATGVGASGSAAADSDSVLGEGR
jgi:hypothetical protein